MEKSINLIVKPEENKLRVDIFVNNREKLISRTRIKNLILKEHLKVNNKIIKNPSQKIYTDDNIILDIPKAKKASLKPYKFKLDIIFEEARSILINQTFSYENIAQAFYLNLFYLTIAISLFYYSFAQARKKGSLINIGE